MLRTESPGATVIRHGWRTIGAYVFVFVTGEVGTALHEAPYPTAEELSAPGGVSLEELVAAERAGVLLTEFATGARRFAMISYGERVPPPRVGLRDATRAG